LVVAVEQHECHWAVLLKMVKVVDFMLCIFSHDEKGGERDLPVRNSYVTPCGPGGQEGPLRGLQGKGSFLEKNSSVRCVSYFSGLGTEPLELCSGLATKAG
jgi:hypothetical protein